MPAGAAVAEWSSRKPPAHWLSQGVVVHWCAEKERARQIIAKLEPEPRGIYTGVVGYFARDGQSVFNIAIRSIVGREGRATYSIGADSDPASAHDETWPKAAGLFAALS